MKKLALTPLLFLSLLLNSCYEETFIGSGYMISEFRELPDFDKIAADGLYEVNIVYGQFQQVEIIADTNIIDKVKTEVKNSQLYIDLKSGNYRHLNIIINITIPEIEKVYYRGAGDVKIIDFLDLEILDLKNMGSGNFQLLTGSVTLLNWHNEGSGDLMADEFRSSVTHIEIIGSGNAIIYCYDELIADIEGSGSVYYYGDPTITSKITGSGEIVKLDN